MSLGGAQNLTHLPLLSVSFYDIRCGTIVCLLYRQDDDDS